MSTHDMDFIWRWADRVLVFHDGQIIADAAPQQIFENEDIITQTKLSRPILYEVATKLVGASGSDYSLPKTTKEFSAFYDHFRREQ